ncbi:uncharacterized protein LOC131674910 [Phymastichus coffea]|uniref:uncharacterized protein LOC131673405 n=1 Tax=Phymastichus coffea TaxID=108790 RepID=UPI00273CC294|nr:uncharacterized protein LOC131673405 [Phymastichus coffea]XP_058809705.1 uncharacterized protein LOC131674910 [Phymastichus coffea]
MNRRTTQLMALNSCERIRPERPRNAIQRLVWVPGSQLHVGFVGIADDEGTNPRMALRRLLRLYEGRQYREAAGFLLRLPQYTLKAALPDIPIDLLIETLPHSLVLLEALYARLLELGIRDVKVLRLEQLLWRVVYLIASGDAHDQFHLRAWARLLSALNRAAPSVRSALITRRRALERAVEGLGKHGLVQAKPKSTVSNGNSNDHHHHHHHHHHGFSSSNSINSLINSTSNLVPLPVALKDELETRADAYKLALHKIESLGKHAGLHKGDQGVQAASHQRQLSLKHSEVQQRLIDNQGLLNVLERASGTRLDELLVELKTRVEQDKEALRQWSVLRKTYNDSKNQTSLAAKLLQFSRGCTLAIQLMNSDGAPVSSNGSQSGDYYYDEEEEGEESSSSAGYHTDESCSLTPEPSFKTLQGLSCQDAGAERLCERYAALYTQASQHTLEALNGLLPLKDAPELKTKILYSIVVLSWRLAGILQASRRIEALKILNGGNTHLQASAPPDLEDCIRRQLATVGAQSGARDVAHQVTNQLERTLYDFPCLRDSNEVKKYTLACSRLAWACLARNTPLVLEVAHGQDFRPEIHSRHRSSTNGMKIKAILWPGLREGCQGPFLHKIVVVTN